MRYFSHTNEYLYEARGGEKRATLNNKYSFTCGKQRRRGKGEEEEEENREDNYQVKRTSD